MEVAQQPVAKMRGPLQVQHHEALATELHAKGAAHSSREDVVAKTVAADISDGTELRLRRSAEAAQATVLLTQVQWCMNECPDTQAHRDAFNKILDLCRGARGLPQTSSSGAMGGTAAFRNGASIP